MATTMEEIADELESLSAESLIELARFVEYLKWKQGPALTQAGGQPWTFDFVEHFRRAIVTADHDPAGMEVQVGEATCNGDSRMALWQHPPVQGSAIVEYQVPVPAGVTNLRLRFATGIRDGSRRGFNSTTSAPITGTRRFWIKEISSRVDKPPGSWCDTPGANAGSSTSRSTER